MNRKTVKNGVDLFPRTSKSAKCAVVIRSIHASHVKTVVLMSRKDKKAEKWRISGLFRKLGIEA